MPSCHQDWFLKWVPLLTDMLIRKCRETPRIPRLYQILMTCMQTCSKYKFFSNLGSDAIEMQGDLPKGEKFNVFNRLLSFFKDLTDK